MHGRLWVDEKPVQQFQRKRPVNLIGVVPISFEMVLDHAFETILLPVRAGESARIKQHFANVTGKEVFVPDAEMVVLVSAQKKDPRGRDKRTQTSTRKGPPNIMQSSPSSFFCVATPVGSSVQLIVSLRPMSG
jgi:hypothetical protein